MQLTQPQSNIPPTQLDPQVVNLAKAIRQSESGGNFTANGASGEYGAYQYTEPTWDADSQKYLGTTVPLKQATPEQQNEVAYKKLADLKSQGLNVGQIASVWNSGDPEAYTGKFSTDTAEHKAGDPSIGTNGDNVKFNVPAYAKSVATAYQTLKNGGNVGEDKTNPSATGDTTGQPNSEGFITSANIPQAPTGGSNSTDPGILGNLSKGDYGDAIYDAGKGILNGGGKLLNGISSPFASLAAIPVQALAKGLGQPDPYTGGIGKNIDGSSAVSISPLTEQAKGKDLLNAGITSGTSIAGGLIGNAIKATPILDNPVVKKAISDYIPEVANGQTLDEAVNGGAKTYSQMSDAVESALKTAKGTEKRVLLKAFTELQPLADKEAGLAPTLLQKAGNIALKSGKGLLKSAIPVGIGAALGNDAGKVASFVKGLF